MTEWQEAESLHYIFHYKKDSFAQNNISKIIEEQEERLNEILSFFRLYYQEKSCIGFAKLEKRLQNLQTVNLQMGFSVGMMMTRKRLVYMLCTMNPCNVLAITKRLMLSPIF